MEAHTDKLLYFDINRVTMFRTRTAAKTSIKRTLKSEPNFIKDYGDLRVVRLTPQPYGESYTVEVDYEQEIVLRSMGAGSASA